jgi:hypothetical protein
MGDGPSDADGRQHAHSLRLKATRSAAAADDATDGSALRDRHACSASVSVVQLNDSLSGQFSSETVTLCYPAL